MLSDRALNRSLLARQLLLERSDMPVRTAVEHLIGLQAQKPDPPHVGLWTRLRTIRTADVGGLLDARQLVRIAAMRSTIHLPTAADALALRPVIQSVLDRELRAPVYSPLAGVDVGALARLGRRLCSGQPLTWAALGDALAGEFPGIDRHALAIAVRNNVALVQVPPRGRWRTSGPIAHVTAESWLDAPEGRDTDPAPVVLRYLAAFGPATAADIAAWSGLRGIRAVLDRLGDQLRVLTDERGRTLLDVHDGPLPDPDTPAPVRLLPEYDNALLSHADRNRIIEDADRGVLISPNGRVDGTVLVDGFVRGTWRTALHTTVETVSITSLRPLSARDRRAIERESLALLDFASSGLIHRVAFGSER